MPSKDDTITTKETVAVDGSESSERALADGNDTAGSIDLETFGQILEMDDDEDDRDFSRAIVYGFMEQAEDAFQNMKKSLESKDLTQLSSIGHFLKGSSATLGLVKVKDYCEKIQNLGSGLDETGNTRVDDREGSLARIKSALGEMEKEYWRVHVRFSQFYDNLAEDPQL